MSVKLTTNLSQRLVLTPQLRQRIEMLQMTSLELTELIQQQLLENPILEEVESQVEKRELEKEIIDQFAGASDDAHVAESSAPESMNGNSLSANGTGDAPTAESFDSRDAFESAEPSAPERAEEFGEDGGERPRRREGRRVERAGLRLRVAEARATGEQHRGRDGHPDGHALQQRP